MKEELFPSLGVSLPAWRHTLFFEDIAKSNAVNNSPETLTKKKKKKTSSSSKRQILIYAHVSSGRQLRGDGVIQRRLRKPAALRKLTAGCNSTGTPPPFVFQLAHQWDCVLHEFQPHLQTAPRFQALFRARKRYVSRCLGHMFRCR